MPQRARPSTPAGPTPAAADPVKTAPVVAASPETDNTPLYLPIQRKLTVGAVDDPLEKEADATAEQVMRMPATSFIQRKCAQCAAPHDIQRQPMAPFLQTQSTLRIQRTPQPFMPDLIAAQLKEAMDGWGTDEDAIYAALAGRSQPEVDSIALAYQRLTNRALQADLQDELSGDELARVRNVSSRMAADPAAQAWAIAVQLREAMAGWGTNEEAVYAALAGRPTEMRAAIDAAYQRITGRSLMDDLRDDLTESEMARALQLMNGATLAQLVPYLGDELSSVSTASIENSDEYRTLMDPQSPWQQVHHVNQDEARVMSLLILNHLRTGGRFNWAADGANFLQSARRRLEHTAARQNDHTDRLGIEIGVTTLTESTRLFNEMSQLTFFTVAGDEVAVPYFYPANGCYSRAYLMEQRLTALGYASRKEFILSYRPNPLLRVVSDNSRDVAPPNTEPVTEWVYHVAPVMSVQQANGQVVPMVIDPSLFNRPVPVKEWVGKMGDVRTFQETGLESVRTRLAETGGSYGSLGRTYYSTDRDAYFVGDLPEGRDGAAAIGSWRSDSGRKQMGEFAVEKAPAHQLAAIIRQQLRLPVPSTPQILARINATPVVARLYFSHNFKALMDDMFKKLPVMDSMNIISALNAP